MTHYFETPSGPEQRRQIQARFWDTDWTFVTASGVFSSDGLDQGTAVLLRTHTPSARARRLLDLGCGYGVLAVALASAAPQARVDAVDTNERALALTELNARAHGVGDRVQGFLPEDADPDARYDEIWSNPPIRIGKQALHALLSTWLARLAPGGVARLVVGRNLGADSLQRWLEAQGWRCARTASAKGFRVFAVEPLESAADRPRVDG
ncbi:MAG: class I SAM-dependent methyltransferase [Actinomycetes bacterium]